MTQRDQNPQNLLSLLVEGMKAEEPSISQLAALMYKKMFLDDSRSESLSPADLEVMKESIMSTICFSQNITLLKRKGDILSKIFAKLK